MLSSVLFGTGLIKTRTIVYTLVLIFVLTKNDNTGLPKQQQHCIKVRWIWAMIPCTFKCPVSAIVFQFGVIASSDTSRRSQPRLHSVQNDYLACRQALWERHFLLLSPYQRPLPRKAASRRFTHNSVSVRWNTPTFRFVLGLLLCYALFDIPDRTSCIISSPSTSSWKWAIQNRWVLLSKQSSQRFVINGLQFCCPSLMPVRPKHNIPALKVRKRHLETCWSSG